MKKLQINIPIFQHRVTIINCSIDTMYDYLHAKYNDEPPKIGDLGDCIKAACFIICGDIYIWWEKEISFARLAHEVIHAVNGIIRARGINIRDEETFCYLVEYIIQTICTSPGLMEVINLQ